MVVVRKGISVTLATKLRALAPDSTLAAGNSLVPFHVGVSRGQSKQHHWVFPM